MWGTFVDITGVYSASILGGLVLLAVASELLLRGAVTIAVRLNISPLVIGLTVVALATSAPEFVVSINAVLRGASAIVVGNIIGSNIANILLILGVSVALAPFVFDISRVRRESLAMLAATLWFVGIGFYGEFSRFLGSVSLILLGLYIVHLYFSARGERAVLSIFATEARGSVFSGSVWVALIALILGGIGLYAGADLLIYGGIGLARQLGISESVIGLTVVALGTSLPELAVSVMGIWRKQAHIVLGNVLGSNIANILLVLSASAVLLPIPIAPSFIERDIWVMLATSAIAVGLLQFGRPLGRGWGVGALAVYGGYIYVVFT